MKDRRRLAPRRVWLGAAVLLLLAFLAFSLRRVPEAGEVAVRDSAFLKTTPRVLPPGWHFVPAGFVSRIICWNGIFPFRFARRRVCTESYENSRASQSQMRSYCAEKNFSGVSMPPRTMTPPPMDFGSW